jgi:ribonuclease HII
VSRNLRTIIGIDEAGYGPMLGPLVVGLSAFRTEVDLESIRTLLPVPVDDSKRLFSQATGLGILERSVLAFAGCAADARVPDDPGPRPAWGLPSTPRNPACDAVDDLAAALGKAGVEVLALETRTVTVPAFNAAVERSGSKAAVLFETAMEALAPRLDAEGPVSVVVDRHGGRKFYSRPLEERLPGRFHWVEKEERDVSAYVFPTEDLRISFEVKADRRHLPVALASMAAKYVRERWMAAFNDWFAGHDPDLRRTAGYVTDARRWLADTADLRSRLKIDEAELVRLR